MCQKIVLQQPYKDEELAAEMKLLRPVAGYTLYDHKKNDCIRHEIRIAGILDKIDEYRLELAFNTCKEYHKTESL